MNYRTDRDTRELLLCLRKCHYPNLEVWVVDNGSPEPPHYLENEFPEFRFIFSPENLGFAGGNNLAIKACNADLIYLLNNDTLVEPDFLDPIPELFLRDEKIGIVSSRLMYAYENNLVQFAGSKGMNPYTGRSFSIGWKEPDREEFHRSYPTATAHGAAMCIRRDLLEKTGLLWEGYFLYYEELDYCERCKHAGYSIWYCGSSEVRHKESKSTGKDSPLKTYYLNRNRLIFIRRNFRGFQKWMALLFYVFIAFPKNVFTLLLKGEWARVSRIVSALIWNLSHPKLKGNTAL